MRLHRSKAAIAALAAIGTVAVSPAFAGGAVSAVRSAEALPVSLPLPMLQAGAASVPYADGMENTWQCVQVNNENLGLRSEYARVDAEGRVVVDAQGAAFRCRAPTSSYNTGGGAGFPWEIAAGILAVGGGTILLVGSDDETDSEG